MRLGAWWLVMLVPLTAFAAEQAMRALDPGVPRFWWALVAVQVLWLVGYGCSSLHQWAGWIDDTGGAVAVLERRLKIVQGMLLAFLAGNTAYFVGYYYYEMVEVMCFGAAAIAAYGGDKFLSPMLSRVTAMFQAAFGFGKTGG